MGGRRERPDKSGMSAAALTKVAASSSRLLADVQAFDGNSEEREPALSRLEEALGRDFADKLLEALIAEPKR
jgi:hypothetical protein